jgi:hypothetical protein
VQVLCVVNEKSTLGRYALNRILPRLLMCDDQPILKGRVWHFYGSNLAELTRDLIAEDAAVAARQKASPQRSIMDLVKNRTGQPASN